MDIPNDTIPDISPALAETHAAPNTPTPVGMVIRATPVSTTTVSTKPAPRRYAIIAFFAIVPIAILAFVMVRSLTSSQDGAASVPERGNATTNQVVEPQPAVVPDAGVVIVDAPAVEVIAAPPVTIDAGVRRKPDRAKPDRAKPDRAKPATTPDAGTQGLPDIDFIDVNKKK